MTLSTLKLVTLSNDTRHYDIQAYGTQHNNIQQHDTKHYKTKHNDTN
jgi:hypothetical protein